MPSGNRPPKTLSCLALASAFVRATKNAKSEDELRLLMESVANDMGFRWFALIHHDDLTRARSDRVDIKRYPDAITDRLIVQRRLRRDPVIRGALLSGAAFLWSDLKEFMPLDDQDFASLRFGADQGLNEGITVPYYRLGDCMGSCTFAGTSRPERAHRYLGAAQMIGVFAFQAALRLLGSPGTDRTSLPRLHPRPRGCVMLAGRGYSNKQIAHALAITPRTVDGYLTAARNLFGAHDRTELVISAILAGEVGLHELKAGQPE